MHDGLNLTEGHIAYLAHAAILSMAATALKSVGAGYIISADIATLLHMVAWFFISSIFFPLALHASSCHHHRRMQSRHHLRYL